MSRADEQLMSQLIAKVRENLSDANYNVEALAAGEFGRDICLGSGNVTCSTGEKVECVIRPFGLD